MSATRALCLAVLACAACEGDPSPAVAPTSTFTAVPATAAPPSTVDAPGARYRDDEVPVAEDFEEEAEKVVTADNYQSELRRLEAEIKGEPAPTPEASAAPTAAPSAQPAPTGPPPASAPTP